jgi:hypothetical protein
MKKNKKNLSKRRVHIPARNVTFYSNKTFTEVLPQLRRRHSALVYLVLYHYAWHNPRKRIWGTFAKLAILTGLDYRTVKGCVRELEFKRFIVRKVKGTSRSHLDTPCWEVPATEFEMSADGWVPVPSFIVTHYIPANHACAMLPLICYYENRGKSNVCFAGISTLRMAMGWRSDPRAYETLARIGQPENWASSNPDLPLPLEILPTSGNGQFFHRYHVRALNYFRPTKGDGSLGRPELALTAEFAAFFGIETGKSRNHKF